MSHYDPYRTQQAVALLRTIAEKIERGATMPNANASDFYQKMRVRNAQFGIQMRTTERELAFLAGIEKRLKGRKRK